MTYVDKERWRVAHHEASHQAMAYALGQRLGPVSIKPTRHHLGIAFWTPPAISKRELYTRVGPIVPRVPARLRRSIEARVMVALAGRLGEGWAGVPPETGFYGDEDVERSTALLSTIAPTPSEAKALSESDVPHTADEDKARAVALVLADDDCVMTYLAFLRACTTRYVSTEAYGSLVKALAT